MGLKHELIAFAGELVGTCSFLFLGLGGIQTAINSEPVANLPTGKGVALSNDTVLFISTSMGLSLLVTVWMFYRISGGLFNPAVTFSLWLIGGLTTLRAVSLTIAQIGGGILGAGLANALTPFSIGAVKTTLAPGMNKGMGLMLEAFLTAMLVFAVLMLAAEKHRATYLAPVCIGLTLFVGQLLGTQWTGCGMNPARAFAPSVIATSFPGYHWIYWVGPYIGSLIATGFYLLLKAFDYPSVVFGQDTDDESKSPNPTYFGFTRGQKSALTQAGVRNDQIDRAERGLVAHSKSSNQNDHVSSVEPKPRKAKRSSGVKTGARGQETGAIERPNTHTGAGLGGLVNN